MITLDNVAKVFVTRECLERYPCGGHTCTVHLIDGRTASCHYVFEIAAIVCNLADEKINPDNSWNPSQTKAHFKGYTVSFMGHKAQAPETVLTELFSNSTSQK